MQPLVLVFLFCFKLRYPLMAVEGFPDSPNSFQGKRLKTRMVLFVLQHRSLQLHVPSPLPTIPPRCKATTTPGASPRRLHHQPAASLLPSFPRVHVGNCRMWHGGDAGACQRGDDQTHCACSSGHQMVEKTLCRRPRCSACLPLGRARAVVSGQGWLSAPGQLQFGFFWGEVCRDSGALGAAAGAVGAA